MYHGDDSGHLIVFVNGQIIKILFEQKEGKTYNFLIEQQLIELAIEKNNEGYEYVVTPQRPVNNTKPEQTFDKHFWIPLILLLLVLNLAFFIIKYIGS